jgi:hypothetical protein
MVEWSITPVLKTGEVFNAPRGFESYFPSPKMEEVKIKKKRLHTTEDIEYQIKGPW